MARLPSSIGRFIVGPHGGRDTQQDNEDQTQEVREVPVPENPEDQPRQDRDVVLEQLQRMLRAQPGMTQAEINAALARDKLSVESYDLDRYVVTHDIRRKRLAGGYHYYPKGFLFLDEEKQEKEAPQTTSRRTRDAGAWGRQMRQIRKLLRDKPGLTPAEIDEELHMERSGNTLGYYFRLGRIYRVKVQGRLFRYYLERSQAQAQLKEEIDKSLPPDVTQYKPHFEPDAEPEPEPLKESTPLAYPDQRTTLNEIKGLAKDYFWETEDKDLTKFIKWIEDNLDKS